MKQIISLLIILLFLSCKTVDFGKNQEVSPLLGIVFDNKSDPVKNAKLTFTSLENKKNTFSSNTDINGKFLIPELEFGEYKISVIAKGYVTTETSIDHFSVENVLIIKMTSYDDLLTDLEKYLKIEELELATKTVKKLDQIDSRDQFYNYLKSIYFIKNDQPQKSEETLLSLAETSGGDPYVYQLLGDLYQYKLEDQEKAAYYHKRYIKIKGVSNDI